MTEPKLQPTAAPPSSVVVLEDRALVTRRGEVTLSAGRARLVIQGVAPVLVDRSLAARFLEPGFEVTDARVVRTRVVEETEEIDDEIRRAEAAVEDLEGRARRLHREAYDTDRLLVSFLDEIAEDTAWARPMDAARRAGYEELVVRSRALAEKIAANTKAVEEERRILERKREKRRAAGRVEPLVQARVEIDVEAAASGRATLSVEYLAPNACWRPRHRATLSESPARVSLETEGVVWQNTGEDWSDVELRLSTERASLGAAIPSLATDRLVSRKKGPLVVEAREEQIHEAGLGGAPAVRRSSEMPGIEDGGVARSVTAPARVSVPSDGRPHAVPLGAFDAPAELELVVTPELVAAAIPKTTFVNAASGPILAGPVDLIRRGGAVGKTRVGFIAPGEKVALGWNPDPALRVHREVESRKDETSWLGSWFTQANDIRVRVHNLGREPKAVTVSERVPVSEIEKVKIEVVAKETTGSNAPDENGILTWKLELLPYASATVKLRVVIKKHSDVSG